MCTITVIIPVYNAARYLADAIESVLAQTRSAHEIIVVDDGSSDGSAAAARARAPRVRCVEQANQGAAAARNTGVEHASGDVLTFLDADDLWLPEKLARQVHVLAADPLCDAVFGGVGNFVSPEVGDAERERLARSASQGGHLHVGALAIRRAAFERVGRFDARWRHGEFLDWWARATARGVRHAVLPEVVLRRRLHRDNLTRREADACRADYLRLLREHVHRHRGTAAPPPADGLPSR